MTDSPSAITVISDSLKQTLNDAIKRRNRRLDLAGTQVVCGGGCNRTPTMKACPCGHWFCQKCATYNPGWWFDWCLRCFAEVPGWH